MARNSSILIMFCGLIIVGAILTGCTTKEEKAQGIVDENIVLGPGETSKNYYIIIPDSKATDFTLTSDIPVNIDCSDWLDIDKEGVTKVKTRIQTGGIAAKGPVPLPLPGSKFQVTNPDPNNKANIHITLTGVKLYG
jgi:hypothetical protein